MDIFEKCGEFTAAKEAIEAGLYPYFIPLSGNEGTEAEFQGHRLIMCGSNNYLGLTTHPKVRQAAVEAIVPIASWTADAETRHTRSKNAATTLKERWNDDKERERLDELSRLRSESLEAVTKAVIQKMQRGKGSFWGGELTVVALSDKAVSATPFPTLVGTAQRWTVRRICKALCKEGTAKETLEERKGRRVRCFQWVPVKAR